MFSKFYSHFSSFKIVVFQNDVFRPPKILFFILQTQIFTYIKNKITDWKLINRGAKKHNNKLNIFNILASRG